MSNDGLAQECIPANEQEATQKIIELLKRRLEREYPGPNRTLRDAHPKQHGLVRAEFIVETNLRDDLRIGLFAEPKTYQTWVRFSNMRDPPGPDSDADSRGMAIKVMGVDGLKLLEDQKHASTQDFVLMSSNFFVTKDVAQFAKLVGALEAGTFRLMLHLLVHPYLLLLFMRVRQRCSSVLEIAYGSTTPYLLGNRAVKYCVRPISPAGSAFPKNPSENFLRDQMVQYLSTHEAQFQFLVQFQTDVRQMPIEDPRVVWSESLSPWEKVATLRIGSQQFDSPAQREYGDNLSFSPWHSLPVHRPLGGINRARKVIYETMSRFRHDRNEANRNEPTEWINF